MRKTILFISLFFTALVFAETSTTISIPQIQGTGNQSPYVGQTVTTEGVVTAKFIGSGMINGFFLQDKVGDNNSATSDGIFVYLTDANQISVGDDILLTGRVSEYYGRTQIQADNITIRGKNAKVEPTKLSYDELTGNWERYEGMLVEIQQMLWVDNNYNLDRYGELELRDFRKQIPTNLAFPRTEEYSTIVKKNGKSPIYLDDAYTGSYKTPAVFADEYGTRRTGEKVEKLLGVVDYANSKYVIYPVSEVEFFGNPRRRTHNDIGDYNLKVAGFNLEYYLTSPNSSSMGPSTQLELERQHTKIVDAMIAIDADIYGLLEIEQGQKALTKLTAAMNSATGSVRYAYIDDGTSINGTYTKAAYIYRTDKVTPHMGLRNINNPSPINRKKLQAFTLKSNGERFIFSLNHFKAKSGCENASGADADQGDGQSCFNATRVAEAKAVISAINGAKAYYADEDVLVMGDLNAYAKEDPIREFINAGYIDLLHQFHADSAYSYVYRGEAGYLDHAIANESMARQITGVTAFHINADELTSYGYDGVNYLPDMFRCSDHDPIVVGISLGNDVNTLSMTFDERVKVFPTVTSDLINISQADGGYIQIFSLNGIKLYENSIDSDSFSLSLKSELGLVSGAYIVRLLGENRMVRRIVFVK